jgi:hypothetical protein
MPRRIARAEYPVMNRAGAYSLLSRELSSWERRPYEQLVGLIGQPESQHVERVGGEDVTVTIRVRWADATAGALRVEAVAYGPSCWALERLEESVVVQPALPPAG